MIQLHHEPSNQAMKRIAAGMKASFYAVKTCGVISASFSAASILFFGFVETQMICENTWCFTRNT
jgi:hypothetical protein